MFLIGEVASTCVENPSGRAAKIIRALKKAIRTQSYLKRESRSSRGVFRTLIATILSARNRDESTDCATNRLFSVYRTPKEIANAPLKKIERLIRKSGFYRTKARYVKETSRRIAVDFLGKVPESMEQLMTLPGVGRKVAGCVLVYGFGKCDCIPVDTHVHRISNRLGLVKTKAPEQTEKKLMKTVPKRLWGDVNELFVVFGQTICRPVGPKCEICPVYKYCNWLGKKL